MIDLASKRYSHPFTRSEIEFTYVLPIYPQSQFHSDHLQLRDPRSSDLLTYCITALIDSIHFNEHHQGFIDHKSLFEIVQSYFIQ